MTTKEFIEKAIEGGWKVPEFWNWQGDGKLHSEEFYGSIFEYAEDVPCVILDPKAWEAVGKVEGWNYYCEQCEWEKEVDDKHWYCKQCEAMRTFNIGYLQKMHQMIDHLVDGGTAESYLETL